MPVEEALYCELSLHEEELFVQNCRMINNRDDCERYTIWLSLWMIGIIVIMGNITLSLSITTLTLLSSLPFLLVIIINHRRMVSSYANWVTLFRLLLLFAFNTMVNEATPWITVAMTGFLALDYTDGWLARRFKHQSIFGGWFGNAIHMLHCNCR
jgi:hypothetical protein